MIDLRCRPIDEWIGPRTWGPNMKKAPFGTIWERTRKDLIHELEILDARDVLIGLDVRADQIRQDGWPKANVSAPPAVSLTFTSTHGPLRYQCDRWDRWHSNLRAIGLVLQRQRLVNEAGVGASDQVYRGFSALPPGGAIAVPGAMTPEAPEPMLQFFAYAHLPERLQTVSASFSELAHAIVAKLPRNPERTVALRKLLESKDAAVRAMIYRDPS